MEKDWIKIYSSSMVHMIEIAQTLLEEENIESFFLDKHDSLYPSIGAIELFVHKEKAFAATQIIQKLIESE